MPIRLTKRTILATVAAAAVACSLAAAPSAGAAEEGDSYRPPFLESLRDKTVGVLLTDTNTDLTIVWSRIIKHDLENLGVKFELRDANWNPETQLQALEAFLADARKPDVLVIQNFNLATLAPGIKQALDAGIKIVQLNLRSRQASDIYVGVDNIGMGIAMGEELVKDCAPAAGKSGKIAIVQGDITAADSFFQMQGLQSVLDKHPEIQVVSNLGSDWDASKAHDITATVLQQHPDVCAVYGMWDGHHVGGAEAIKEAGLQGKVLSYTNGAGHRKACDSLASGLFDKYWSYNSERQASDVVSAILMLLQSKEPAGATQSALFTPLTLITKDTVKPSMCFDNE